MTRKSIWLSVGLWFLRTLWKICRALVMFCISLLYASPVIGLVVTISYYMPVTPVGLVAAGKTVYAAHSSLLWIGFPLLMMWGVSGFDSGTKGAYIKSTIRNPWLCWMLLQLAYVLCAGPLAILLSQGHQMHLPPALVDRSRDILPYWLHGTPLLVGTVSGVVYVLLQYPIFSRFTDVDSRHLMWIIPANAVLMQLIAMLVRYNPFMVYFVGSIEAIAMNEIGKTIALRRIERGELKVSATPGD